MYHFAAGRKWFVSKLIAMMSSVLQSPGCGCKTVLLHGLEGLMYSDRMLQTYVEKLVLSHSEHKKYVDFR